MFSAAKDMMISKAAKSYLSDFVSRYGAVQDLKIDTKRCRVEVTCLLNGEREPVGITIEKYRVDDAGGKKFVEIVDTSATRPWLQGVLRDYAHGRRIELPGWAAAAL